MTGFNTVIVGIPCDANAVLGAKEAEYKACELEIPQGTSSLNDGCIYPFQFHGITKDFKSIQKNDLSGQEMKIDGSLAFHKGVAYPINTASVLENPILICTRQGSIYLRQGLSERYLSYIPEILVKIRDIFDDDKFNVSYLKATKE